MTDTPDMDTEAVGTEEAAAGPEAEVPRPGIVGRSVAYEFTEQENVVILRTAKRSHWWGALSVLWGFVMLATGAMAVVWLEEGPGAVAVGAIYAVSAIIPLLIGLNFLRAGRSLVGVAETEGYDIPHLMRALESLGSALQIQVVMAVLGILLFALGMAAAYAFPLLSTS